MTTKQFHQSVTDSIKNLVNKANEADIRYTETPYPESFSDWLKSNSDSIEMPLDRTEATAQWFDDQEQGEKQSIPF